MEPTPDAIAAAATAVDPKSTAPGEPAPAAAQPETPGEIKVQEDKHGRKEFDPGGVHKFAMRGKEKIPVWTKPDKHGRRYWALRPGPGTQPEPESVIRDPNAIPETNPEIGSRKAISGGADPAPGAGDGVAIIEEIGIGLAGEKGKMSPERRGRIERALIRYDAANPGRLPECPPSLILAASVVGYGREVLQVPEAQAAVLGIAEAVRDGCRWLYGWWTGTGASAAPKPEKVEVPR